MVKKTVDPKLEPILDKIEEFDPERADRLRDSYSEEPDALPHGILSGVVIAGHEAATETTTGPDAVLHRTVYSKRTILLPKRQRSNYKICTHCGKKGAYLYGSLELCKYCRPKKSLENIPAGLLKPDGGPLKLSAEPKKKSWLARLLRL